MASTAIRILSRALAILACANAMSTSELFPDKTSTNLEIVCKAGFSIGGGKITSEQETAWQKMSPCRHHCECVAIDGSCKYCCKNDGSKCHRHKPLYKYKDNTCLKCSTNQYYLHEAGVSGSIATSTIDTKQKWVARGSTLVWDLVAATSGTRFLYNDPVYCWSNDGGGMTPDAADSCTDFDVESASTGLESTGNAAEYVTPHLSSVLNQGGCGNCYIHAAMSTATDRLLRKLSATEAKQWKDSGKTLSTGLMTRCHYTAGKGNACKGGDPSRILTQLTGKSAGTNMPGAPHGAGTCTGGVYGGPGITTNHAKGTVDYYSKWDYGCVKGCTPFQAGFAGHPVPQGVTCPLGYTDEPKKMQKGFFPNAAAYTHSNMNQYQTACGCGGTIKAKSGSCTYCGALMTDTGLAMAIDKIGDGFPLSKNQCNYKSLSQQYPLGAESQYKFVATAGDIMATSFSSQQKLVALTLFGCPAATFEFDSSVTKCSKCCIPRPYPTGPDTPPKYQYNPKTKSAQPPSQCTGEGVTAGSTSGAKVCSVGTCSATCDGNQNNFPDLVFDSSPKSVYNPVGMIDDGTAAFGKWHAMKEHFIKDEIAQHGPIAIGILVPSTFMTFFKNPKGILAIDPTKASCGPSSCTGIKIYGAHSVSIVGWGKTNNQKYWLVRNSWGRHFADSGFFRIEIGGGASTVLGLGTDAQGVFAFNALLKPGSARRLNETAHQDHQMKEERKLAQATNTQSAVQPNKVHGNEVACDDNHKTEVDELETWFLKKKANYNDVSPSCLVPWKHVSSDGCTAQVASGLHVTTTLNVKDCNNKMYHITVKLSLPTNNDINGAKVLANSGPEATKADPIAVGRKTMEKKTTPSPIVTSTSGQPVPTNAAWHTGINVAVTFMAAVQALLW